VGAAVRRGDARGAAVIAFWSEDVVFTAGPAGLLEYSVRTPNTEPQWIAAAPDQLIGLSVAPKSDRIILASSSEAKLYIYTLRAKTSLEVALERAPSHLLELQTQSMFLLNHSENGQPAIVLDLKQGTQVFFVPELREGTL